MPVILGRMVEPGWFRLSSDDFEAELWKIGQLIAGDVVRFRALSLEQALELKRAVDACWIHSPESYPCCRPQARAKIQY